MKLVKLEEAMFCHKPFRPAGEDSYWYIVNKSGYIVTEEVIDPSKEYPEPKKCFTISKHWFTRLYEIKE
jgi:hypothetical protein